MKILFLDDDGFRHGMFDTMSEAKGVEVTHVSNANKAIAALKRQKFDAVFLDHDLGDFTPTSDPGDGLEVAEFIALHQDPTLTPPVVVIHSHNPPAAKRMVQELDRVKGLNRLFVSPFGKEIGLILDEICSNKEPS